MLQDAEQKLSGTLSLLLGSEETPQGEGQKEGLVGVPPGRGGPEEADHKKRRSEWTVYEGINPPIITEEMFKAVKIARRKNSGTR